MRELLHADDAERARIGVERALATRTDYDIEYRLVNGTGERWIRASGRGVYDEAGAVTGMLGVVQDISELVRTRDALREQADDRRRAERAQAYLAAIIDSADDAIVAKDLDGIIQSWNAGAERVFGFTAAEIVGKPVRLLSLRIASPRKMRSSRSYDAASASIISRPSGEGRTAARSMFR